MKTRKKTIRASKFMAALSIFGTSIMEGFHAIKINEHKDCIQCGRRHHHNNAFCDGDCCRDWRAENPYRGRLGRYHHPETGEVVVAVGEYV